MRYLSPSLLAAQRSASAVPFVRVQIKEQIGNVSRTRWERLYSGSEADYYHAAAVPEDGSLTRARIEPSTSTLYTQRTVQPGPSTPFDSWSAYGDVSSSAGVALVSKGVNVLLFFVDTDNVSIRVLQSVDNGQSFSSPYLVATAAGPVDWLAAGLKSDGTALLVYSVDATVYRVKRISGVWGSPSAWTNSLASITGLACTHSLDFSLVVTGTSASGASGVWTCIYGDGFVFPLDVWSALVEIARADAGSNVCFRAPFVDRADTRSWQTLPAEIRVFRMEADEENHEIAVRWIDERGSVIGESRASAPRAPAGFKRIVFVPGMN